jgi:endonuclease/exonuclease/phosphatase (EEP) superfamily protein YafD
VWLRRAVLWLAVGYPLALLLVVFVLRVVGERSTLGTIALYLPSAGFGLLLPPLVIALLFVRPRAWLLTQLAAALILLFPIMGLEVHLPRAIAASRDHLRILSVNVDLGSGSVAELGAAIRVEAPDIVLLQAAPEGEAALLAPEIPGYVVRADDQFVVASKYPIGDAYVPEPLMHKGIYFRPSFARYRIDAPGGPIDVYNMHPWSPHGAFDHLRGQGLVHEIASGHLFANDDGFRRVAASADVREVQVRAVAEQAAASAHPVIIAGDTNLPAGSWILGHYLGGYQDGFVEVGRGFGYTFPARRVPAWLRLDRILADRNFKFVSLSRLDVRLSKHFPVLAVLERLKRNQ